MSPVSVVLLSLSLYDVGSWLSSWLLNMDNLLITFLSLKSHNLLWTERRDMFGMLIIISFLLLGL